MNYKEIFLIKIAIIMAVYNAVVFMIPFSRGGGFWSGYGFSMLLFCIMAGIGAYALGREGLKGKFYAIPLIDVMWPFFWVQLVFGFLQMALDFIPIPYLYGVLVNVVFLGICAVKLITVGTAKKIIERVDEKVQAKVFYIKSLQGDVEGLMDKTSDDVARKALKALAETIRYSDPMSSPQLAAIENKIEGKVADLAEAVEQSDDEAAKALCNELQQLFAERNRKCKILK